MPEYQTGEIVTVREKEWEILRLLGKGKGGYSYLAKDGSYMAVLKPEICLRQVKEMCRVLYEAGLNIDYFPTNFILRGDALFYVDYECNDYMDEWNFENWGITYWSKTPQFLEYADAHAE